MRIHTPADLGAAIRSRRRALRLGQEELAARVGVRRQWVVKIESGKATAEVGLVLRTLTTLGLKLEVGEVHGKTSAHLKPPLGISYDIDSALAHTRPKGALSSLVNDLRGGFISEMARESKQGSLSELVRETRRGALSQLNSPASRKKRPRR